MESDVVLEFYDAEHGYSLVLFVVLLFCFFFFLLLELPCRNLAIAIAMFRAMFYTTSGDSHNFQR